MCTEGNEWSVAKHHVYRIRIVAMATINFSPAQVRLLFKDGSYYFGRHGCMGKGYEVDNPSVGR